MKQKFSGTFICLFFFATAITAQSTIPSVSYLSSKKVTDVLIPVVKTIYISKDVMLEYAEQGCEDGIPVILVHGFAGSWHSYEMVLPFLPASLHVYAVSLRGHGNSSKPMEGYHPDDLSKDLASFIQLLNIKKPVLVGHSMGNSIVQHFAINYPQLLKAIILSGSFARYNSTEINDLKWTIDQLTDPVDPAFAAPFQRGIVAKPVPETMMRMLIEETIKLPSYVWKAVAAGWASSSCYEQLKNYQQPALITWGDKDIFCPRADQLLLQASLKRSSLRIYPGTGHGIIWEDPQRFATDIDSFISTLP